MPFKDVTQVIQISFKFGWTGTDLACIALNSALKQFLAAIWVKEHNQRGILSYLKEKRLGWIHPLLANHNEVNFLSQPNKNIDRFCSYLCTGEEWLG